MKKFNFLILIIIMPLFLQSGYGQIALQNAFPHLSFTRPVDLQHAGDGSNRLFVVEQQGRIWVFTNDSATTTKTLFLDIQDSVDTGGNEEGLLGLAFHPDYENNGYFYVNYTAANPNRTVISRFQVSPGDPNAALPQSGTPILEFAQPYSNHNGGQLAFGPQDGYLYIAVGDGGRYGDPDCNAQNPATLLGSILRIDVDNPSAGRQYGIPAGNPFAGDSLKREEIFAYWLRNPWRFSIDSISGQIWAGDVGQNEWEEIDLIENGGNYGWAILEGTHCYNSTWPCAPPGCDSTGKIMPVTEYSHSLGSSVTGGYIYRGSNVPSLYGKYIYADFGSGRLWSLQYNGQQPPADSLLLDTQLNIASFGTDADNELYILAFDGAIYRFEAQTISFTRYLNDSWNLVGLSLQKADSSYLSVFPGAIPGTLNGFDGSYYQTDTLERGAGYWLNFPAPDTVNIQGSPISTLQLSLQTGWNLIAGPSCALPLSNVNDPAGIIQPGTLYGWQGAYVLSDTIRPNTGYWLRADTSGQISLDCGTAAAHPLRKSQITFTDLSEYPALVISDAAGNRQVLYFSHEMKDHVQAQLFPLPPLPPAGAFDARFAGNSRLNTGTSGTIQIQASHYPVTIRVSGLSGNGNYRYFLQQGNSKEESVELQNRSEIHIENPQVNSLKLFGVLKQPQTFALHQNYPNPFNPTTVIRFDIPQEGLPVKLQIFNILGQQVAELVNGRKSAGSYTIQWDGRNTQGKLLPSGLYFARLEAGSQRKTIKLMLMK
ncbi:MAG: PQQ-dependent sugar dehydrogenase [Calditrichia bacterium]